MRIFKAIALILLLWVSASLAADTDVNRIDNPSFEEHDGIQRNGSRAFKQIPGWLSPFEHIQLRDGRSGHIPAYAGRTKLDLGGPFETEVYQDVETVDSNIQDNGFHLEFTLRAF